MGIGGGDGGFKKPLMKRQNCNDIYNVRAFSRGSSARSDRFCDFSEPSEFYLFIPLTFCLKNFPFISQEKILLEKAVLLLIVGNNVDQDNI